MKQPPFVLALFPVFVLIFFLGINVFVFGDDTLSGSNQIILLFVASLVGIIGYFYGISWSQMQDAIVKTLSKAIPAIIILLLIGALTGAWLISGIIPTMIFYGLKIVNPQWFLTSCLIVCAIVSLVIGSSWTTVATVGIALIAIGNELQISVGMTAGAIISGAYFGDKLSPLSDTTNLAATVSNVELFTHIRYMLYTTIPTFLITLIIFTIIGYQGNFSQITIENNRLYQIIEQQFTISPIIFSVPLIMFFVILKKVPAIPALLIGIFLGLLSAILFQNELILSLTTSVSDNFGAFYSVLMKAVYGKLQLLPSDNAYSDLLSSGGMAGMLNTIWLIISAMIFGGMMQATKLLDVISAFFYRKIKSVFSLIFTTASTCIFVNFTASDQYIAIVLPGEMYAKAFREKNLNPQLLSRTLEDAGTVTSVLIPWNTCGATQAAVLGVATLTYLPFAFFNLLSPVMTLIMAFFVSAVKVQKKQT